MSLVVIVMGARHDATVVVVLLLLLVVVQELSSLLQAAAGIAASAVGDAAQRAAMLASAALPFAGKKLVLAGNCLQMPRIVERIRGKYADGQLQTMLLHVQGYWQAPVLRGLQVKKVML